MKKCYILVFCLLFNTILSIYTIENFQEVTLLRGKTEFQYKFTEPNLKEEKDVYFFFKFDDDFAVDLAIRDEDNNEQKFDVDTDSRYLMYKVSNLKSQTYIFTIYNGCDRDSLTMAFLENSKEINTNLNHFLSLSFNTDKMDTPPLPLIFNTDIVEEKTIVSFHRNSEAEFTVEFCEIKENQCDFKENLDRITFEKGKKYKIKHNYSIYNSNHYYFKSITKSIYKEIGMGLNRFHYVDINNAYLIVDIRKYKQFYLYVEYVNKDYFDYSFISESDKNSFFEGEITITFDREDNEEYIHMDKKKTIY